MRKFISLVFAVGLLAGGAIVIGWEFQYGAHLRAHILMAGAVMLVAGGAWLWGDYILPLIKKG